MLFYFQMSEQEPSLQWVCEFFYEFWVKNDEMTLLAKHCAFFASPDILFSELCSLLAVFGIYAHYEKCSSHIESVCMNLSSHA